MPRGDLNLWSAFSIATKTGPQSQTYTMFLALKEMEKTAPTITCAPIPQWLLAMSLRLIGTILGDMHQAYHNRNVAQTQTKSVRKSLTVDKHHREKVAAEEIWDCLDSPKDTISYLKGEY